MSVCNNCGKYGHLFQQCKSPINSYGIIAFNYNHLKEPQFLMIRRKDSFGYIDFIRGKYSPYNIPQLQKIINEMSIEEKERLIKVYEAAPLPTLEPIFNSLWQQLWGHICNSGNNSIKWTTTTRKNEEEYCSFKKYETIVNGVPATTPEASSHTLQTLIQSSNTLWTETEWEFPKGRRSTPKEKELECALREFEEETGINKTLLHVIENIAPFEETFIGTNYKAYKHKYFLAYIAPADIQLNEFQQNEVSKIECVSLEQALKYIRPYNIEKKTVLQHIYNTVTKFHFVDC